jgi:hypothetical protein
LVSERVGRMQPSSPPSNLTFSPPRHRIPFAAALARMLPVPPTWCPIKIPRTWLETLASATNLFSDDHGRCNCNSHFAGQSSILLQPCFTKHMHLPPLLIDLSRTTIARSAIWKRIFYNDINLQHLPSEYMLASFLEYP